MTCSRCKGLMVEDYSLEVELLEGDQQILAWRCVNCGHIIEPIMLRNRLASLTNQAMLAGSSKDALASSWRHSF